MDYRLYFMNQWGHIDRTEVIEATKDETALEAVQALHHPYRVEVWQRGRKIGTVEP